MADRLPFAKPEDIGLSDECLQRIAPLIKGYMDRQLIPGAITMVARHGRIAHYEVQGYQDAENSVPMTKDTIFRIASMTKPIVSVALMMLYEQGRFHLRDPISDWLPAFKDTQVAEDTEGGDTRLVPPKRPIDFRHILTHTAGLATAYNPKSQELLAEASRFRSRNEVIGDFVDRLAAVPLNNHPGVMWDYSRATCVVGRLVEVISGQTLAEYLQEHIFDPLGMIDTHFYLQEEKLPRFAMAYTPGADGKIEPTETDLKESFHLSKPGIYYMGSGGLVSTASDYFAFADMLMDGGKRNGVRILSRKTIELMTMDHIDDKFVWLTGPGYGFGLGFGVTKDRRRTHSIETEGTYTWGGAYCTYWWNDPTEKLFGMVLTQVRPYDHLSIRADFRTLATQAVDD